MLINLVTFQLKLVADGLRDVILFPLAVVAAALGLLFNSAEPDYYFKKLLSFGRESDRFINLFNQHDASSDGDSNADSPTTSDELLAPYQQEIQKKILDKLSANDTESKR